MSSAAKADAKMPSLVTTALVVVAAVFPLLSLLSIYFRYKARRIARQSFHADDWWIVVSWVTAFSLSIDVWTFGDIIGINYYKIDPAGGLMNSLMCLILASALVQVSLSVVKISILLFYKRIFNTRRFKTAVWVAIALLVLLQADPIDGAWTGKGRLRFDSTALGLAQVGSSIALDFVVLCFPLPVISSLHMRTERKVAISLIFWLGAFCCVAAIVRLVLLNQSVQQVIDSDGFSLVYLQAKQFIFMIVEPHCSIIAACLPCYGPLFAGGRAQESLIRSVRSVLSLGSRAGSKDSSVKSRSQSKPNDTRVVIQESSATESQIELKHATRN